MRESIVDIDKKLKAYKCSHKEKMEKKLSKELDSSKIICSRCKSRAFTIEFNGKMEIKEVRKFKAKIRKIEFPINPTVLCSSCYRVITPTPDQIIELESKLQEVMNLFYDNTKEPIAKG